MTDALAILRQDFPACFNDQYQPIMTGIDAGLIRHYTKLGTLNATDLKVALEAYTSHPNYLAHLQTGVERIDLTGAGCDEFVTLVEQAHAAQRQQGKPWVRWSPAHKQMLNELKARFPHCLIKGQPKKPVVETNFAAKIIARVPDLDANLVTQSLAAYLTSHDYLGQLKQGAIRVDLDGKAKGKVTAKAAAIAAAQLAAKPKKQSRLAKPPVKEKT